MTASHKDHISFTDHLGLYLPPFLRPPLPRDLRPLTPTSGDNAPPVPASTPDERPNTPEPIGTATVGPSTSSTLPTTSRLGRLHSYLSKESESDEEVEGGQRRRQKQRQQEEVREVLEKGERKRKSKEGYQVSLILTNIGSVARDHLASERTFLAYVRTSLAMASAGVALVQLFTVASNTGTWKAGSSEQQLIRRFATPLGSTMIALSFTLLLLGGLRFFAVQTALTRGVFPAARLTVGFVVVALLTVFGVVFGVLAGGKS
ncbi:hypothetical protein AN958_07189 [Leucoagaricus sp. SymC.cos]|nr:hypothetical protein AN958_07189 [Leucoagaricus sp. SymC.cos]